ncbi:Nitrogen fixation regulation protein FixK [Roseovarius albus]|uniref:Nitrogen fixation regulation protein FixK n=1 Tax=Roseovarius albus TaxID=1247867 RepID=A0A1X6ZYC1_9RHOB|nr:Crp/Fnr family transcriptional regulator [Roseovarius albus]SLN65276.1 Nitrogen fixation regulation protein FixK [Roseovarius albus]
MNKLDESLLDSLPLFNQLEHAQIRDILNLATTCRFEPGVTVFEEDQVAEYFYLLLDGYIRVIRLTPEGEQIITLHIPSGHLFGIAAALGHSKYPATSVAAAECLCLRWPMQHLTGFLETYAGFSEGVYKTVGKRVADMNNRILELATQQVEQRVANALLRLINQTGRQTDEGIEIDFPITRQDISEMTGSTLHTISRLLSAWEREGTIKSARKKIVVTDPHKLVLHSS